MLIYGDLVKGERNKVYLQYYWNNSGYQWRNQIYGTYLSYITAYLDY